MQSFCEPIAVYDTLPEPLLLGPLQGRRRAPPWAAVFSVCHVLGEWDIRAWVGVSGRVRSHGDGGVGGMHAARVPPAARLVEPVAGTDCWALPVRSRPV